MSAWRGRPWIWMSTTIPPSVCRGWFVLLVLYTRASLLSLPIFTSLPWSTTPVRLLFELSLILSVSNNSFRSALATTPRSPDPFDRLFPSLPYSSFYQVVVFRHIWLYCNILYTKLNVETSLHALSLPMCPSLRILVRTCDPRVCSRSANVHPNGQKLNGRRGSWTFDLLTCHFHLPANRVSRGLHTRVGFIKRLAEVAPFASLCTAVIHDEGVATIHFSQVPLYPTALLRSY